ncbi:MAG: hypothetical protein H6739_41270 [Alphaproteobacteria bacterium]|nr:hypothetical protein [Alphaproteobacteria bacterium]
MSGLWARWVDLLSTREPGTTLALYRVAMGLCILGTVGTVVVHGLVDVIWLPAEHGGYRGAMQPGFLFDWLGVTPITVWSTVVVSMVSGVLLTLGVGGPALGRLVAFVALWSTMGLTDINGHTGGSYDELLTCGLWLLVLADSTRTLSVDCWRRTGGWTDPTPILAFPRYLVVFQLVLAYWSTGAQKVSAYWTPAGDFSALYYILQQPSWQRWDMQWLAWVFPATQLATISTWMFELGSPLLLLAFWFRRTEDRPGRLRALFNRARFRDVFAAFGVGLHVGVFILMNVGPFSAVTLALYVCLFHPDEWQRALDRLRPPAPAEVPATTLG